MISFLESWLEDRVACVVVSGAKSDDQVLANSVFQGTVLGPPLWDFFYADARFSVREHGFTETVFADDFNCWKTLDKDTSEEEAVLRLSVCQNSLHRWGAANRVTFDFQKEEFIIIRRRNALGPEFRLLGVIFDAQLLMHKGVRKIAVEASRLSWIAGAERTKSNSTPRKESTHVATRHNPEGPNFQILGLNFDCRLK